MTSEVDGTEGYSFEEAFSDFAKMENYESEHFLVYRRLVDESWNQAYEIFEDIDSSLNSFVPGFSGNSLQRYVSRRGIDQAELLEDIREMDRFMDIARYGEMRGEEAYSELDLEDFEAFLKQIKNTSVDGSREMERAMKEIDEKADMDVETVFDNDEEAYLAGLFIRGISELEES